MIKKEIVMVFALLLCVANVNAVILNITTIPNHTLWITGLDADDTRKILVSPMEFTSDNKGQVFVDYYVEKDFSLGLKLKNGAEDVLYKKIEQRFSPYNQVNLEFFPENYVEPVIAAEKETEIKKEIIPENITINATLNSTSSEKTISSKPAEKKSITFNTILNVNKVNNPYIIISAIALILIVIFIMRKRNIQRRIKCIDNKIFRLQRKREKLLSKLKQKLISQEEALIKFRGGSVPKRDISLKKSFLSEFRV